MGTRLRALLGWRAVPAQVSGMGAGFGATIGLAGVHQDEAVVGGERCVVGVDGIESEGVGGREMDDFGSGVG